MHAWSWAAAVLLALVMVAGVGPEATATSAAPAWGQAQKVPLVSGEPTSLSCPADGFCAASDDESVSVLLKGSWQSPAALPRSGSESAVSCASSRWCVAVIGRSFLVFDGAAWGAVRSIDDVSTAAHSFTTLSCPTSDFCVAGAADGSSAVFDGLRWRAGPSVAVRPDDFLRGFMRLSCTSRAFCMAMVETEDGYGLYRLRDGAWRMTLGPSDDLHTGAGALSCLSETFCMGGGTLEGKALRWNGDAWTETVVDTGSPVDAVLPNGMSCVSATLCVAVGTPFGDSALGYAFQWDGTSWSARSAKSPKATPDLLSCSSAHFCMALTENNVAIPVYPASGGGGGGGADPAPADQPPRFDAFPTKTVYPGDTFVVRATDPDEDPVTLAWSALPTTPVKVKCALTTSNEARCSARAVKKGRYAPTQITFTARAGTLTAQAPLRVSMRRFVGLGDSYSSGEGAPDDKFEKGTHFPSATGDVGCHRSPHTAWEVLLGRQLVGTKVVSTTVHVACSGARFTDLYNTNSRWADLGESESPQLSAVNRDTVVATMTMGGNDVGFEAILKGCTTQPTHPGGVGCSLPGRAARVAADRGLSELRDGLVIPGTGRAKMTAADVYENVAERMADGGTLVVGGYPHLFSTQTRHYKGGVCAVTDRGPLGTIVYPDALWIDDTVDTGNAILRNAVEEAQTRVTRLGFKTQIVYADPVEGFGDDTVCSGQKTSLINYAKIRATPTPGAIRQSFHPTKDGQHVYYKAFCDLVPVGRGVEPSSRCRVKEPK